VCGSLHCCSSWIHQQPSSTLFPYTTLFRSDIPDEIGEYIGGAVEGVRNVATTLTNVVVAIVTFPIILFFLLKDGHRFKAYSLQLDRKSTRLNFSHVSISYAVFCLKKKNT